MPILALILLIVFALVVLTGFILSLIAESRPVPRLPLPFPTVPQNEFFQLVRILTMTDTLWHPGRGDLPDPTGVAPAPEFPNHPME
jgi:hypothetical protein